MFIRDPTWPGCAATAAATATKLRKRCSSSADWGDRAQLPVISWEHAPHRNPSHVHLWMSGNQTGSQQAANNLQWPQTCIFRLCKLFSWVFCQGLGRSTSRLYSPLVFPLKTKQRHKKSTVKILETVWIDRAIFSVMSFHFSRYWLHENRARFYWRTLAYRWPTATAYTCAFPSALAPFGPSIGQHHVKVKNNRERLRFVFILFG